MSDLPYAGPEVANPCECKVLKEWTDYNGHFNVAYYARAFDLSFGVFLENACGGGAVPAASGETTFTHRIIRSRVQYLREVHLGRLLQFTTQVLGATNGSVSVLQAMYVPADEYCAAVEERVVDLSKINREWKNGISSAAARHAGIAVLDGWGNLTV
ncbi:MAG: acyl-CoA thioesterase [Alphaproteobacteria bacterium]